MKEIPLSRGRFALVDDDDFARLSSFKWHVTAQGYAARNVSTPNGNRTTMTMHREILGASPTEHVDHHNMNRLDNRRVNIRLCSNSQNTMNRPARNNKVHSRFKGVTWDRSRKKWLAQAQADGVHKFLGRFNSEEDAARAYNAAASRLHGEFAQLNQI